jgi:hypothetical protein
VKLKVKESSVILSVNPKGTDRDLTNKIATLMIQNSSGSLSGNFEFLDKNNIEIILIDTTTNIKQLYADCKKGKYSLKQPNIDSAKRPLSISGLNIILNKYILALEENAANMDTLGAIMDKNNRYHAPNDNFVFEGQIFSAGEYLPEEESKDSKTLQLKIKIRVKDYEKIYKVANKVCNIKKGSSWYKDNEEICYCYLSCLPKKLHKEIREELPTGEKEVMLFRDGLKNIGKPFKCPSYKKIKANFNYSFGYNAPYNIFEHYINDVWKNLPFGYFANEEIVEWFGEMICYKYHDDIIR